jgi:hypothetical protein
MQEHRTYPLLVGERRNPAGTGPIAAGIAGRLSARSKPTATMPDKEAW